MIIAVDFDGTLHDGQFPNIGRPRTPIFNALIKRSNRGDKIILWTCRDGRLLTEAIMFCNDNGLHFDAINDNLPMMREKFGSNPRKIYADLYLDDKSITNVEFLKWFRLREAMSPSQLATLSRKARII